LTRRFRPRKPVVGFNELRQREHARLPNRATRTERVETRRHPARDNYYPLRELSIATPLVSPVSANLCLSLSLSLLRSSRSFTRRREISSLPRKDSRFRKRARTSRKMLARSERERERERERETEKERETEREREISAIRYRSLMRQPRRICRKSGILLRTLGNASVHLSINFLIDLFDRSILSWMLTNAYRRRIDGCGPSAICDLYARNHDSCDDFLVSVAREEEFRARHESTQPSRVGGIIQSDFYFNPSHFLPATPPGHFRG